MQALIRRVPSAADRDAERVARAAELLGIRLVELFRCAHRAWFGEPPGERELDRIMAEYLLHQRVPHWVRDYARRVHERHERGRLDPREFGVENPGPGPLSLGEQRFAALLMLIGFLLFLLFSL